MSESDSNQQNISVLKFLELALTVTCLVLHYYSFNDGDIITAFLSTGTFCGFIVILLAVFFGYLMKSRIPKRLDIFLSLMGSALFEATGVLIIEAWEHSFRTRTRDLAILKGSVSIITGVLFLFDCIFTFKNK